ncbi:alpha/beta hydrolase [Sphingomonas sp.]|uniref:alpha/beta hydrolase n=1 Tax=Sphingomonas sp. TaxID=28214 RepID=UPI002DD62C40|nr:alpha/beta hydrolase [Sphingomonas sp.]
MISERHTTNYLSIGDPTGQLMIFMHGWPESPLVWHNQMEHFAAQGWHCVAPQMRGYGKSSVPRAIAAYAVREIVDDMVELHNALGSGRAVWVGHDWGAPIAWSMASHHPERCLGVVNLCVPYFARAFSLPALVSLIDRALYPVDMYPVGQWDYWLYYREHFGAAATALHADPAGAITAFFQFATDDRIGKVAPSASTRQRGGLLGGRQLATAPETTCLPRAAFDRMTEEFRDTGFLGPNSWYMNDDANIAFAREARNFGRIDLPALFIHAEWDWVCETVRSDLAKPMREDCTNLTEAVVAAGHHLMLEQPTATTRAIDEWCARHLDRSG